MDEKLSSGTVVNMRYSIRNGIQVLEQLVKYAEGAQEWKLVEEIVRNESPQLESTVFTSNTEFTSRFKNTDTIPHTQEHRCTAPLFRKPIKVNSDATHPYLNETHEELMARTVRMHATLLRVCGGEPDSLKGDKIHVKDKASTSREILQLFCEAMGGGWKEVGESIV